MSTALGVPRFIRIEGYNDNESFTSRYGPSFRGQDYNGVVDFHGDSTTDAVDRFIELTEVQKTITTSICDL